MSDVTPLVLYVDDDPGNRLVFEQTFKSRFHTRTVASGVEALAILGSHQVAVLVTDQRMPGMSGNELLKEAKERHPTVVRVVVTAYADLEPILQAVNEGLVARYVIKPWVRTEVEQLLAWALDAWRLGRESSEVQLRLLATERLVTLGVLSQTIFHDLSQPLTCLTSIFEELAQLSAACTALKVVVAARGLPLSDEPRQAVRLLAQDMPELVQAGSDSARKLQELVRMLHGLGSPRPPPGHHVCDPWRAISFALTVTRRMAFGLDQGLLYSGAETLPEVAIGETELAQVLLNLLGNAVQATRLKQPRGTHVTLACRDAGAALELTVTDDGVGMTPALMDKVGRQFFSTRADGTGLGLFQCRRLVEGAGGTLAIESELGRGTTVRFTLRKTGR